MNNPKFLFEPGNILTIEKFAPIMSGYPYEYCHYNNLSMLPPETYKLNYIPVGSVQYIKEYCKIMNLELPNSISYYGLERFLKRDIREGNLEDASDDEFVKPKNVKQFTGDIKKNLRPLSPKTKVWISPAVPFESEFRFYIHDFVNGPKIFGWSRYDDLNVENPNPDLYYIRPIMESLHKQNGPISYSIDIGWRTDIQEYDVVELNDAWALGYYKNNDKQSNPPSEDDYVQMLISRWNQILFCNIV